MKRAIQFTVGIATLLALSPAALDQEGGNFSATLINRDGVFVLFGSCTPL
jgi:hypothetical protein